MGDIGFAPAADLVSQLRAGQLSSRELLEHYLARVAAHNDSLNAVVTVDPERARAEADACDAARQRGDVLGPLHGLPMTVKDQFCTAGMRTTFGSEAFGSFVPTYEALPVARLRAAGAVIFGKTNTPPHAADVQTHNRLFGTTRNPWDVSRTPGGSSGGAAAAVAAGLTGLELGGDLAGSIRIPAHYCGVYGHKPSFGLVADPPDPSGPPGYRAEGDIASPGPLGRSADDLDLGLDVLAGPDAARGRAWRLELPAARRTSLGDFRVAAWLDDADCPTDPEVLEPLRSAVAALRAAGVAVDEAARPGFRLAGAFRDFQRLMFGAMCTSSLPLAGRWPPSRPWVFSPPLPGDSQLARAVRFSTASHRDWILAHEAREAYRRQWADLFDAFDVLLCPASPVAAIRHDHRYGGLIAFRKMRASGPPRSYMDQMVWPGVVGMAYLPATVAPIGRTPDGLPVGVQIVGPYLEDRTPIDFARRLAGLIGGYEPPPGY